MNLSNSQLVFLIIIIIIMALLSGSKPFMMPMGRGMIDIEDFDGDGQSFHARYDAGNFKGILIGSLLGFALAMLSINMQSGQDGNGQNGNAQGKNDQNNFTSVTAEKQEEPKKDRMALKSALRSGYRDSMDGTDRTYMTNHHEYPGAIDKFDRYHREPCRDRGDVFGYVDADEHNVYHARFRNEPTRVINGSMDRINLIDRYVREDLDNAENSYWWGRHEY